VAHGGVDALADLVQELDLQQLLLIDEMRLGLPLVLDGDVALSQSAGRGELDAVHDAGQGNLGTGEGYRPQSPFHSLSGYRPHAIAHHHIGTEVAMESLELPELLRHHFHGYSLARGDL